VPGRLPKLISRALPNSEGTAEKRVPDSPLYTAPSADAVSRESRPDMVRLLSRLLIRQFDSIAVSVSCTPAYDDEYVGVPPAVRHARRERRMQVARLTLVVIQTPQLDNAAVLVAETSATRMSRVCIKSL